MAGVEADSSIKKNLHLGYFRPEQASFDGRSRSYPPALAEPEQERTLAGLQRRVEAFRDECD